MPILDSCGQHHQVDIHSYLGLACDAKYQDQPERRSRRQHASTRQYSGCHMASCTSCTMSDNWMPAKPSAIAVSATATATVADTLRRSSTCGSSDAPGWRTVTRLDTALAAALNIPLLIWRARATMAPRQRPGYKRALFMCPTT